MFDDKGPKVSIVQVKRQEKLPYTITDIGGKKEFKKWKVEQKRKQEIWDAEAQNRYLAKKVVAEAIVKCEQAPPDNSNDPVYQRWANMAKQGRTKYVPPLVPKREEAKQTLKSKIIEFFLNINF